MDLVIAQVLTQHTFSCCADAPTYWRLRQLSRTYKKYLDQALPPMRAKKLLVVRIKTKHDQYTTEYSTLPNGNYTGMYTIRDLDGKVVNEKFYINGEVVYEHNNKSGIVDFLRRDTSTWRIDTSPIYTTIDCYGFPSGCTVDITLNYDSVWRGNWNTKISVYYESLDFEEYEHCNGYQLCISQNNWLLEYEYGVSNIYDIPKDRFLLNLLGAVQHNGSNIWLTGLAHIFAEKYGWSLIQVDGDTDWADYIRE